MNLDLYSKSGEMEGKRGCSANTSRSGTQGRGEEVRSREGEPRREWKR